MNQNNENLNLRYDLSRNIIYGVEINSLQDHCFLTAVKKAFKSETVIVEITRLLRGDIERPDDIFSFVRIELELEEWPFIYRSKVDLTIRLIYSEISRFLEYVIEYVLEDEKEIFLRNLVFNLQGAISPLGTVLQVLRSNTLLPHEKFEISCFYLFDENEIRTYFNNLTPDIQNRYLIPVEHIGIYRYVIIYFWIWKFTHILFEPPYDFRPDDTGEGLALGLFLSYITSKYCTAIGIRSFIQNVGPPNDAINIAIRNLTRHEHRSNRINILMYLLFNMNDNSKIRENAYYILRNFIENSRWHDIFISYFILLRGSLQNIDCFNLILSVVRNFEDLIEMEGLKGKYATIMKEFIYLIPGTVKLFMKVEKEDEYSSLVFSLFRYHDIKLMARILNIYDIEDKLVDICNYFYTLAKDNFDIFKEDYIPTPSNGIFLGEIVDEERAYDLLRSLND